MLAYKEGVMADFTIIKTNEGKHSTTKTIEYVHMMTMMMTKSHMGAHCTHLSAHQILLPKKY